jgi:hypothetical protein
MKTFIWEQDDHGFIFDQHFIAVNTDSIKKAREIAISIIKNSDEDSRCFNKDRHIEWIETSEPIVIGENEGKLIWHNNA